MKRGSCHGHNVADCNDQVSPTEGAEETHVMRAVGEDTRAAAPDLLTQTRLPLDGHLESKTLLLRCKWTRPAKETEAEKD